MAKIHLICNAHIDPVWQWDWQEGKAAAIATFRVAARFCEEFDGFIFNHNEALLYKWVEEYEPELFNRIKVLVGQGKWHIMGGWYLQPDCNMPSGESFVRQILEGREYFREKFGVTPHTAINFDSFGHSRGLVQILKKTGFDSYIIMRPEDNGSAVPAGDFIWVGFDDSEIVVHKLFSGYSTVLGESAKRISEWLEKYPEKEIGLVTWGVGNHGGGPSKIDLIQINEFMKKTEGNEIVHSCPENYFAELNKLNIEHPRHYKGLNPRFVGCYTSQAQIKQKHRKLENELYMAEKMAANAFINNGIQYPEQEMKEALEDLLTAQFHDVLPGTSVKEVEESSIRLLDHGLELTSRIQARAFFALAGGQERAKEGEIPILIYNPHPFRVRGIFECEFMLANQNWAKEFTMAKVFRNNMKIPSQPEKEASNVNLDWRKKVAFYAELEPSQMNRFDCRLEMVDGKPQPALKDENGKIVFKTDELEVVINCNTGLIDEYRVNNKSYLKNNSFAPLVMSDNEDPWRMDANRFDEVKGKFVLMSKEEGTGYSGVSASTVDSVRVIEDGEVRSVIEAVFRYNNSFLCQTYKLPKKGTEIHVNLRVNWNERNKMLKLSVPTVLEDAEYYGQAAYGVEKLPGNGDETVAQKWTAAVSNTENRAVTCINDCIYGSDSKDGEIRLSLLRGAAYCAHPIGDRPLVMQDRFSAGIDQGERIFDFWINGGSVESRMNSIDREALVHNEKPAALSFFPAGEGSKPLGLIELNDDVIQLASVKKTGRSQRFIFRLFEPTGREREVEVNMPALDIKRKIKFGKFEIKTLRADLEKKELQELDHIE